MVRRKNPPSQVQQNFLIIFRRHFFRRWKQKCWREWIRPRSGNNSLVVMCLYIDCLKKIVIIRLKRLIRIEIFALSTRCIFASFQIFFTSKYQPVSFISHPRLNSLTLSQPSYTVWKRKSYLFFVHCNIYLYKICTIFCFKSNKSARALSILTKYMPVIYKHVFYHLQSSKEQKTIFLYCSGFFYPQLVR